MIRFVVFVLLAFIVYNIAKFFIRTLLGYRNNYGRMDRQKKKSKYEDVEEANFREIGGAEEKKEKT